MIDQIIKELSNRGIAYRGEVDGMLMFEGMQNGYKAVLDTSVEGMTPQAGAELVLDGVGLRRVEWEQVGLSKADPIEAETFVAMKTGERGGKHVLINGTWYYASKEV